MSKEQTQSAIVIEEDSVSIERIKEMIEYYCPSVTIETMEQYSKRKIREILGIDLTE